MRRASRIERPDAVAFAYALVASVLISCTLSDRPTSPPSATPTPGASRIAVVDRVLEERQRAPIIEMRLSDGHWVIYDLAVVRTVHMGAGEPRLLVAGRDDRGEWIAVVGHQAGTPEGCFVLNGPGFEFGTDIAIAGVRWPAAFGLVVPGGRPAPGSPYPSGTRFCLDELGRVNRVILD